MLRNVLISCLACSFILNVHYIFNTVCKSTHALFHIIILDFIF